MNIYNYNWNQDKKFWFSGLLMSIISVLIFLYSLLEREVGIISSIAHDRLVHGMPRHMIMIGLAICLCGFLGALLEFLSFTGSITLSSNQISKRNGWWTSAVRWDQVDRVLLVDYLKPGALHAASKRSKLTIVSKNRQKISIYSEIDKFDDINKMIYSTCIELGIPFEQRK